MTDKPRLRTFPEEGWIIATITGGGFDLAAQGRTREQALERIALTAALEGRPTPSPAVSEELVERVAQAMQVENRPASDCRNSDQREADEAASLNGYKALARAAIEALASTSPHL